VGWDAFADLGHSICGIAVFADGIHVAAGCHGGWAAWDVSSTPPSRLPVGERDGDGVHGGVTALAALPRGLLAVGCGDGTVQLAACVPGTAQLPLAATVSLAGHTDAVRGLVALPPDNHWLASASMDGTARVWSVAARTCIVHLALHAGGLMAAAALPDGRLACLSEHGTVAVWDPAADADGLDTVRTDVSRDAYGLTALPDGGLAIGYTTGALRLWEPATGKVAVLRPTSPQPFAHSEPLCVLPAPPHGPPGVYVAVGWRSVSIWRLPPASIL